MNDFRSFVRYLVPGLTFLVEFVFVLTLANPHEAWNWLDHPVIKENVAVIFGGILALGGFGYLIGMVHHNLYWSSFETWYATVDFRGLVERLQNAKYIFLEFQEGSNLTSTEKLSRAGAWRVVTALWYGRRGFSPRIKGATNSVSDVTDMMHGAGSALIACLFSIVIALVVAYSNFFPVDHIAIVCASILLPLVHWMSYRHLGKQAQGFAELILFEELASMTQTPPDSQTPFIYRISKSDISDAREGSWWTTVFCSRT